MTNTPHSHKMALFVKLMEFTDLVLWIQGTAWVELGIDEVEGVNNCTTDNCWNDMTGMSVSMYL